MLAALAVWLLAPAGSLLAQTGSESRVGYVDTAIPVNRFRLRTDFYYDNPSPDRGEFGYSHTAPRIPGQPAETRTDYQEVSAYVEGKLAEQFSVFAEVPLRTLNPTFAPNATGLSDVSAGFKYAFYSDEDNVSTFQLRVYGPTGNRPEHLGSGHATVEPALLAYLGLPEGVAVENELRLWIPVGADGSYASYVARYGLGVSCPVWESGPWVVAPLLEVAGWTFLNGHKTVNAPDGTGVVVGAGGDTVVNAKLGVRVRTDYGDFYAGYARALTNDSIYKDNFRLEYRYTW
jgi:hypothetical protein